MAANEASPGPLLTTNQVAELLQVHPKHVYRLLKQGLPGRKVGGEWRFLRGEVLEWTERPSSSLAGGSADLPPPLLAANGDLAVELLLRSTREERDQILGILPSDRTGALRHLRDRRVLVAGHHGALPDAAHSGDLLRIHLVSREVGLVARTPWRLPELENLSRVRLASRPRSAGVRDLLDESLEEAGCDPERAHENALILGSHLDVVLAVTTGNAQTGVTTRAWARRAGLAFKTLREEPYRLLLRSAHQDDPRIRALVAVARGPGFRRAVSSLGGYDAGDSGEVAPVP
ncbi:MAG TPA: helix-turn-helix transcriptional regulator [Longimicrobiales bacterium]|nr:helix-turn-helix transcriptional regulator [Longimicrobiales bacterium]